MQFTGPISRRAVVTCATTTALFAAFAAPATAGIAYPDQGASPAAADARSTYEIVFWFGSFALAALIASLLVAAKRFRADGADGFTPMSDDKSRGMPLAIAASLVMAGMMIVLALVQYGVASTPERSFPNPLDSTAVADDDKASPSFGLQSPRDRTTPPGSALTINANGQQYLWRYTHGDSGVYAYHDLVVPARTTILMNFTSSDVIHSWWVPRLGGKFDAVPGYVNKGWFRADRTGVFTGSGADLSGANHAGMTTRVRVVSPADYGKWLEKQGAALAAAKAGLGEQNVARELKRKVSAAAGATDATGATHDTGGERP